jgi:hypothetical protein
MEALCSLEMSVDFQLATQRYVQGDWIRRNHRCESLKLYKWKFLICNASYKREKEVA